jgi:hypothetical protein
MAANFAPILLAGAAAALYFLSKGKNGNGAPTNSGTPLPDVDEGVTHEGAGLPQFKTEEEKEAEAQAAEAARRKEVLDELRWKRLPAGYELPDGMTHEDIWVSADCQAAAIGRDWKPEIKVGAEWYEPAEFWSTFGEGRPPLEGNAQGLWDAGEQRNSDVAVYAVRSLTKLQEYGEVGCADEIPNVRDFDTREEFMDAWNTFNTSKLGLASLYAQIAYADIGPPMLERWEEADPDAWTDWHLNRTAKNAIAAQPNGTENEQTGIAYEFAVRQDYDPCAHPWVICGWAVEEGEVAPEVIDPSNPAHEPFKQLWLDLNEKIQELNA